MKNIKEVLEKLNNHSMNVHEISLEEKYPFHYVPYFDTHFIMKGCDILFIGNKTSLERWVMSL